MSLLAQQFSMNTTLRFARIIVATEKQRIR
jgi:hypothetical protein